MKRAIVVETELLIDGVYIVFNPSTSRSEMDVLS